MTDYTGYVRDFYELYVAGRTDEALSMLTDDVEWRAPNCLPYGGVYYGRDGVMTYATTAAAYYDYITVEVEDAVEAATGRAVVVGKFGGRTKAMQTEFEVPFCQIWEFRDGKGAMLEYWNDSGAVLRALGVAPEPLG
ncbi:MAG: nuclear transport factor 2 family protein [Actinomycetia bacterium]|nr:nuclear transport factor 2 family protein [Actinomycetes bacterium]